MKLAVINERKPIRDYRVELLRVIGCLIVIGVHTALPVYSQNSTDLSRLFISCIFADGVAIFWMIAGFFFFGKKRYTAVLTKAGRHIFIPMALFSVFYFYFGDWITGAGTVSLTESLNHSPEEYRNALSTLLTWTNPVPGIGHLWYLYAYLMIMAAFPFVNSFVSYLDEDEKRQGLFICVTLIIFIINDISGNKFTAFSHHSINAAVPAAIEMIWGHILFKNRERLLKPSYSLLSIAAFVLLIAARIISQQAIYPIAQDTTIMYWYSAFGILCATSLCAFCLSLPKATGNKAERAFIFLGSLTFNVYLFHIVVRNVLNSLSITQKIQLAISQNLGNGLLSELTYSAIIVTLVFLITGTLIAVYRYGKHLVKKCCPHILRKQGA